MIPRPEWLGRFYGGTLNLQQYEVLTLKSMSRADIAQESALMTTKWFDYRRLHPMQATYYFVHCYNMAHKEFCRKYLDADSADYRRACKEQDFLQSRDRNSFWRLRQQADELGIPYEFFLTNALNISKKMLAQGKTIVPPRPSQILRNEELLMLVMEAWLDFKDALLQYGKDPIYRTSSFQGKQHQLDHEAFVVEQIKKRANSGFSLHAAMYLYDIVRVETAIKEFGPTVVGFALSEGLKA